jgi:hypothetical protein
MQSHLDEVSVLSAAHPLIDNPEAGVHINRSWGQSLRDRPAYGHDGAGHHAHAFHCIPKASLSPLRKVAWQ